MFRLTQKRFKLKDKDKLRVDLKHPVYYILAQIAYVDNMCNMYMIPKDRYQKYLIRMYQIIEEKQYKDAKYIHSWHPVEV